MSRHTERTDGVETPILEARDVSRSYRARGAGRRVVKAVDGVSIALRGSESVGLVGESGCGKSTLSRCLLRLIEPTRGQIIFDGRSVLDLNANDMRRLRRE
ncbi:MAG: ATP-binding cassette domain-containing protein, partial [Gemmatimonadota bacterium]|nr:ATP-binding cassette domain-containing protein [Gemmatimonadota bacterium]